jgi:hypothetical protein
MISTKNIISMSGPNAVENEEYFEEEILSYYEDGLSTIMEGDDESCTSHNDDHISVMDAFNSPARRSSAQIPENISWTPEVNSSLRENSMESPGFAMLSPLLSHDSRKISSLKSPLLSARKYMRSPGRPSPNSPGRLSPNSPGLPKVPLTFTSFTTGEEILVEDDDEYTFVSCSDAESLMGASLTNFDAPFTNFEEDSFPSSASDLSVASTGSKVSSGSSSAKSVKSAKSVSSMPLDFESTRRKLQSALESRRKRGKMGVEGMDYFRRKLRLDLSRRMFDEQLSSCMHIPAEG